MTSSSEDSDTFNSNLYKTTPAKKKVKGKRAKKSKGHRVQDLASSESEEEDTGTHVDLIGTKSTKQTVKSKQAKSSSSQKHRYYLSLVVRKPVFGVSDQVPHKPGCTATEDG